MIFLTLTTIIWLLKNSDAASDDNKNRTVDPSATTQDFYALFIDSCDVYILVQYLDVVGAVD